MQARAIDPDTVRVVLESRPEVLFAYLFGSAGSGQTHARSDVDVAVMLSEEAARQEVAETGLVGLWVELHGLLQAALGREDVDLVLLHRASPLLAERVIRTGKLLFSRDEPRRLRWIVETKKRYCDLRPLRLLLDRAVSRRIRDGLFGTVHG